MTLKHVLKLFSKTEVQEDKTHPCPPLESEGVNVSCAEHTVKVFSSFTSHFSQPCLPSPDATRHPLPGEGNKVSCLAPRQNKTHPNHLSQTILNRLFGRVLESEGVNVSCAEHTVKHLFSYSPIHLFTFKKAAFTLAEVLITLGIIGVVAALTLPTLIKNYQKQVYVNQLKSAYSILGQGFKKMLADEGVDNLYEIPEFANVKGRGCIVGDNTRAECVTLTNKMQQYFKFTIVQYDDIPEDLEFSYLGFSEGDPYRDILAGPLIIFPKNFLTHMFVGFDQVAYDPKLVRNLGGHLTESAVGIALDINGYKGPNMYGRDIFDFTIGSDGILYPSNGIDAALWLDQTPLESNTVYWRNNGICGDPNGSNIEDDVQGLGCAARIMENGWKMDY